MPVSDRSMLMASPDVLPEGARFTVHALSPTRYEVRLDTGQDEEIDAVTQAFLTLKQAQFTQQKLDLAQPMTAEEYRAHPTVRWAAADVPGASGERTSD